MEKIITLAGFGDFSEDMAAELEVTSAAARHGLEFYPTYYDHELKGTPEAIEALTMELWSMPRDQWSENALVEGPAGAETHAVDGLHACCDLPAPDIDHVEGRCPFDN